MFWIISESSCWCVLVRIGPSLIPSKNIKLSASPIRGATLIEDKVEISGEGLCISPQGSPGQSPQAAEMQVAATSSAIRVPCASARLSSSRSSLGNVAGLTPVYRARNNRAAVVVRAADKQQVCLPRL